MVDRNSFKAAEKILQYLKDNEMLLTRGAIMVGNKTDLERHREVPRQSKYEIYLAPSLFLMSFSGRKNYAFRNGK